MIQQISLFDEPTLQFEQTLITIALPGDDGLPTKKTRPGTMVAGSQLVYYHEAGRYVITHLVSGFRMPVAFRQEKDVQELIRLLLPMTNWNRELSALAADPTYRKAKAAFDEWMHGRCYDCGSLEEHCPAFGYATCRGCNPW